MDDRQRFSYTTGGGSDSSSAERPAAPALPERTLEQIERASRAEGQKAYEAAKRSIEEAARGKVLTEEQRARANEVAQAEGRKIYALAKKTYTKRAYEALYKASQGAAVPREGATATSEAPAAQAGFNFGAEADALPAEGGAEAVAERSRKASPSERSKIGKGGAKKDAGKDKNNRKKGKAGKIALIVLGSVAVLAAAAAALFMTGVVNLSSFEKTEGYTYQVDSYDTLMAYLKHPSLKAGDTLALSESYTVDVDKEFGGFAELPLFNVPSGGITFTGGTVYMSGGEESCSAEGLSFSGCEVYINAPNTAVSGQGIPSDDGVNVLTLNGESHLRESDLHFAGERFTVPVRFENVSGSALSGTEVKLSCPGLIFANGGSFKITQLAAGETGTADVEVIAVEGGRHTVLATAFDPSGAQLLSGRSEDICVMGEGFYSGDIHTHSSEGISNRSSTVEENISAGYNNGMSFLFSVEVGAEARQLAQSQVDSLVGGEGRFVQIAAGETGDAYQLLIYGSSVRPNADYEATPERQWSLQDAINEALDAGAVVYIPHMFDIADINDAISKALNLRGVNGIEIMSTASDYGSMEQKIAMNAWNNLLSYGQRTFGFMASNNYTAGETGMRFIRGILPRLDADSIMGLLSSGLYFSSNGPELRFRIGSVEMGGTVHVDGSAAGAAFIHASDVYPLTEVTLYRYPVTHDLTDLEPEVVFSEDYTGKGVFSVDEAVPVTLSPDEYYRLEVHSEHDGAYASLDRQSIGFAASNPIWVEKASASDYSSLDGVELPFGGEVMRSDNGTYYVLADNMFMSSKLSPAYTGAAVETQYHMFNSEGLADYVSYCVYGADGTKNEYRVYVVK